MLTKSYMLSKLYSNSAPSFVNINKLIPSYSSFKAPSLDKGSTTPIPVNLQTEFFEANINPLCVYTALKIGS